MAEQTGTDWFGLAQSICLNGMGERTVKCPICGEPYKVMPFYAGDQSACPKCRDKAEKNMGWR